MVGLLFDLLAFVLFWVLFINEIYVFMNNIFFLSAYYALYLPNIIFRTYTLLHYTIFPFQFFV